MGELFCHEVTERFCAPPATVTLEKVKREHGQEEEERKSEGSLDVQILISSRPELFWLRLQIWASLEFFSFPDLDFSGINSATISASHGSAFRNAARSNPGSRTIRKAAGKAAHDGYSREVCHCHQLVIASSLQPQTTCARRPQHEASSRTSHHTPDLAASLQFSSSLKFACRTAQRMGDAQVDR